MKSRIIRRGYIDRSSKERRKTEVEDLVVGMYVSELDRPWLETPFLLQGFYVENQADVDALKDYCDFVYIDATKETYVPPEERAVTQPVKRSKKYTSKVAVADEHRVAGNLFHQARNMTKNMLEDVRVGRGVDTEQAKETVSECVDSILRNPDALLWLSRIKNKDEYTAEHSLNVCVLSISFGRHLGLDEDELQRLGLCGLLHDTGKMRTPHEILNKEGRLSDDEFSVMKAHTVHGRDVLMAQEGVCDEAIDVAYSHHERLDGSGYPRSLEGTGISHFSRIVAITDTYDAITSNRVYSSGRSSLDALRILYDEKGSHYDERLVIEFIRCIGVYPPGSVIELTNGMVGIVLETNRRNRRLPKVVLFRDIEKQPIDPQIVDLIDISCGQLDRDFLIKSVLPNGTYGVELRTCHELGLTLQF